MATATTWITTAFLRGGTSKGLFFTDAELPLAIRGRKFEAPDDADAASDLDSDLDYRDAVLCAALGSPDPFGRQLDGMGGGVSSLSKAMIVGRSRRPGIDLDYTFAQVPVMGTDGAGVAVDYSGNCGNLSSGVVPFALAAGLVERPDGLQRFALYNLNTGSRVDVRLTVVDGRAAVAGDLALPGVAGTGSPIELVYPDPGGSRTAGLLPTGSVIDVLRVAAGDGETPGGAADAEREVRVSIVDAAIPLVLVPADELGLTGAETPAELESRSEVMRLLERLRRAGAVAAGLCDDAGKAPLAVPKVVVVAPPADAALLDGSTQPAAGVDVLARTLSMGRAHGAVPGTGAMCLAAAALVAGTVVHEAAATTAALASPANGKLRIGTPSGAVTAAAVLETDEAAAGSAMPVITETALARTARVLMRGEVAVELAE